MSINIQRSEDNGRALVVVTKVRGKSVAAMLDRDFLDDMVGNSASEDDRRTYVANNAERLKRAIEAKAFGGMIDLQMQDVSILSVEE